MNISMSIRKSIPMRTRPSFAGILGALCIAVLATGCVQPAYDRTILFEVNVSGVPNVQAVGVRGRDKPLSWQSDMPLTQRVTGGPFVGAVTFHTGYLATEVKFTVNGEFELADQDNRIVRVAPTKTGGDTTVYRATYNVR
jgi:putative oxidoreductase